MKFQAELNHENTNKLKLNAMAKKVFAKIDEREYNLEASEVESDVWIFKYDKIKFTKFTLRQMAL